MTSFLQSSSVRCAHGWLARPSRTTTSWPGLLRKRRIIQSRGKTACAPRRRGERRTITFVVTSAVDFARMGWDSVAKSRADVTQGLCSVAHTPRRPGRANAVRRGQMHAASRAIARPPVSETSYASQRTPPPTARQEQCRVLRRALRRRRHSSCA